jgi:hypothetical protein
MNFFNFFTKRQNVENDTTVAMTVDHQVVKLMREQTTK